MHQILLTLKLIHHSFEFYLIKIFYYVHNKKFYIDKYMKIKCILNEIKYEDNIILITSKGDFKIPVKNGTTNIPILNKKKIHIGLINLKIDNMLIIKHKNNFCKKITLDNNYDFLSSEESDIILTDSD